MIRRSAVGAAAIALTALALVAPAATAAPVATNDAQYGALGAVFPDPMAGCSGSPCSPNAIGRTPATQFIQFEEFLDGLRFMNQKPEWQRFMEVWPLDGKLGDGAGTGTDTNGAEAGGDVPGNNLGRVEFTPSEAFRSAGLAQTDSSRRHHDLVVVRVTDESVPDRNKKRYTLSLSIHGIERAGVEGGTRAMEELVTAGTATDPRAKKPTDPIVSRDVDPRAPTVGELLRTTIIYFTYPNPDGWQRGSVSEGGVFFQRYTGNGIDPNRDWPDIGYTFRPYSGLSEPETRAFAAFYDQVRASTGADFAAGDDLHGMPEADALSYTLLPHGKHDYGKDIRIRETAKTIHLNSEKLLAWSPIIQPNDQPRGGAAPCAPTDFATGPACSKIYSQTWGTVYDTIDYTTTGTLGDWFDSSAGLNADGIDNEMAFSHIDKNIVFDPHTEQLHVDGNKALIYAHLAELSHLATGQFDPPGRKGYVPNERLERDASAAPTAPAGSKPHAPIDAGIGSCSPVSPDSCAFTIATEDAGIGGEGIYNGGMRVDVRTSNVQGIGTGSVTLAVQCKGCDVHRAPPNTEPEEWVTVAEDFNQSALYAQAGITAAVNHPQATKRSGRAVEWRALVSGPAGAPTMRVEFTSDRATTDGNTGGDAPPQLAAYDVANTDFFRDLNRFVASRDEGFDTIDPRAVIEGRQSLDRFDSIVLADDPLPGYAGSYGGRTRPTGGPTANKDFVGNAPQPAADSDGTDASYHRERFTIGPNDNNASATIRIEWVVQTNDFDMDVYRVEGDKRTNVGESHGLLGTTNWEEVVIKEPTAGDYLIEVKNYASAEPTFNGTIRFQGFPPTSQRESTYTVGQKDAWAGKLRSWVEDGGNLILTDGALRLLPELTGIPDSAVERQTVYASQVAFATTSGNNTLDHRLARNVNQRGSRFGSGNRRQMYEPTPLGFAIQDLGGADASHARQYHVNIEDWQEAGGTVAGTSIDAGSGNPELLFDRVTLGELRRGKGRVRIAGGLLPQPSTEFDHPLGIEPYALTFTGYIVMRNLFDTTARGLPGLPGSREDPTPAEQRAAEQAAGRNFVISRRAVKLRRGIAAVRVSCRSPKGCKGTFVLRLRQVTRVRGKRRVRNITLGKARFDYPARRRNALVRVRLGSRQARAASVKRRQRVTGVASVRFGDGTRGKPSARFWLYRPSRAR